ncbi:MAG: FAD-dependent oxidoreductase [Muribaculaceae bacterium]|nr:FAD-dependent oxidoreductase [Muribaculaceae bacterium]
MDTYDIVVIGGGTAGCAAAYISGKLGLKTLLIEKTQVLGGAMTSGLVVPIMNTGKNQINTEFYENLISELKKVGGQLTYQENPGWFNPEILKIILDKMMDDANVEVVFNTELLEVLHADKHIRGLKLSGETLSICTDKIYNDNIPTQRSSLKAEILSEYIEAKHFIDATGNCDFSKKINCEFLNDSTEFQPMSLRFLMSGIDCEKFADWIEKFDSDRTVTTVQKDEHGIHFSTAYTWDSDKQWALAPYFNSAVEEGILKDEDRNYFQMFSVAGMPGTVAFNCPRIIENLNPSKTKDVSYALKLARASILRLAEFCKKYLPGFEKAYISNISDAIGVRVSNRIKGKYIYTIEDLKSGKKFENPALISSYPIDVHNKTKDKSTCEKAGEYQLPIESLMAADYDNLFVAGRCLSADYMAQGALRVQASCFSMGESVAKYIKQQLT